MESKLSVGVTGFTFCNDPWEYLEYIAKLGYKTSQNACFLLKMMGGNREENIARYKELGLSFYSVMHPMTGMPGQDLKKATIREGYADLSMGYICSDEQIEATIKECEELGVNIITVYNSPISNVKFGMRECEKEVFFEAIEYMERTAEKYAKHGIQYAYHNHDEEFTYSFDGMSPFDHILAKTSTLALELDVGWVKAAGVDPVALIHRCSDRVASFHVKDLVEGTHVQPSGEVHPNFTTFGTGMIDADALLGTIRSYGYKTVILEQDDMRNLTIQETLQASILNMKETGFVE